GSSPPSASVNVTGTWSVTPGASVVLGQGDAYSSGANWRGESAPWSLWSDGRRLVVADTSNNRVLIWNSIPTSSGKTPNVVLGQADFSTVTANTGGIGSATLNSPQGVTSDGTRLFVSDSGNNRVLIWNAVPTRSGTAAN